MASDIEQAIRQICEEKGISYEAVIETIEAALSAAYRKDYGNKLQNLEAEFDPSTGGVNLFDVKNVVEDLPEEEIEKMRAMQAEEAEERESARAADSFAPRPKKDFTEDGYKKEEAEGLEDEGPKFNPKTDIMVSDAQVLKMGAQIGDIIRTALPLPGEFGRMAAMTAKQVITQKLREAEREIIFNEYKEQEGEVLIGTVQRREGRVILVDIGRTVGVIAPDDQVPTERYNPGDKIKVYVREVALGSRGPQISLSRTSSELVRVLFEVEIPEVADGIVQIKAIAREAGSRSKVAVSSTDDSIDPIGASIGQRGVRIQTIISELGGEKIDVIEWSDDQKEFIINSLAPAKVKSIEISEADGSATAEVAEDQLSLAIGRGGQNVRLAAKLTGLRLSVRGDGKEVAVPAPDEESSGEVEPAADAEEVTQKIEETQGTSDEVMVAKEVVEGEKGEGDDEVEAKPENVEVAEEIEDKE
ncbi:MAG: transcription termination factor NusA [Candidatus Uhrbacteria bacterium]|nr:transcription termination factor NusA [Candidatus Uhrbacteria bacterium]